MTETTHRIALTPGEPAGIGPDLCVMLAQQAHAASLVVIADPELLQQRAQALSLPLSLHDDDPSQAPQPQQPGQLRVMPVALNRPVQAGQPDPANARYVLETITRAARGCLQGDFAGMVTGPVHKGVINEAGIRFSGHTEMIAELTGAGEPVMMLTAPGLRVALATIHIPLRDVADALTRPRLRHVLHVLNDDLQRRFGLARPRILVSGLNPHAGEGGHIGTEEKTVIEPVLDELRQQGMDLLGPLPADTLFTPKYLQQADAVLAMYHDQGLPVLKHLGFGRAVNITLGLPIIRTSVDHGTAFDLAGTGHADVGSLEAAVRQAIEFAQQAAAQ